MTNKKPIINTSETHIQAAQQRKDINDVLKEALTGIDDAKHPTRFQSILHELTVRRAIHNIFTMSDGKTMYEYLKSL